jgi:hypothetical protein
MHEILERLGHLNGIGSRDAFSLMYNPANELLLGDTGHSNKFIINYTENFNNLVKSYNRSNEMNIFANIDNKKYGFTPEYSDGETNSRIIYDSDKKYRISYR